LGVAEDHDSNPVKIGLGKLRERGARVVSVNPVRTGYSAIADEWIGIRPGTDGALVLALVYELLRTDRIDLEFLVRFTNAHWLVVQAPGSADHGRFARDAEGRALCWARCRSAVVEAGATGISPAVVGRFTLPDGQSAAPVFALLAERYLDAACAPEAAEAVCGVPAATIRRLAAELASVAFDQAIELDIPWTDTAGRHHATTRGRPVAMHAMRGIAAHSNGFDTTRAIHLLQTLLGTIDCPGGFRFKQPFPKPILPGPKPAGKQYGPGKPLGGMPLGLAWPALRSRGFAAGARWRTAPPGQSLFVGGAARHPRHDADGHRQRRGRRPIPDRHAVPVHGQHGMELGDEHRRHDGHADSARPGQRRALHSTHHRCRCLRLGNGRLCRPGAARHHLS
jgi:anaerobic selenocysteine-containing dehydrogenase